jgi:predicted nuclease of restriction endonuclease-like (RecB) superfamily
MTANVIRDDYGALLRDIKDRIHAAQYEALKAVNKELISLYWDIGRMIVERQKDEGWGKAIVEKLARDLQKEFPGVGGFSPSNLWRMRVFYQTYGNNEKLAPMVREIGWSHNIIVMERCRGELEREFYIRMTHKFGWTKNVLTLQIENQAYEKTLLGQTNFEKTLPASVKDQAKLAVKDEYTFDFLELGEEHTERELERALIAKIEGFLREMGGVFAFLGSQYQLEVSDKEYFVDLLLFHRHLRCLVAVELKVTEFKPEYVGKMQFYLTALDETMKLSDENPSIGIILCKTKDRVIVEYALRNSRKPIGVAGYRIVDKLPKRLQGQLPSPEQIEKLLEGTGEGLEEKG